MMIDEEYAKLGIGEQEEFRRLVNTLLAHTFLLTENLLEEDKGPRINPDYVFVETHYELFQQYLSMAGFSLERDSNYGIISLKSSYEGNRVHFDKLTTIIAYTLRLIYDEKREALSLAREILLTTGELVAKMTALGAIKKKPSNLQLHESLATLKRFSIISKREGKWEEATTKFLILPTILFIVSNEQIATMARLLDEPEGVALEDEEEE